ncbi:MAG: hypothetical protein IPP93_03000 [Chitinophagaceae bacterium]|nr:hypothetical protein [Chitinophagaceae bacterium]
MSTLFRSFILIVFFSLFANFTHGQDQKAVPDTVRAGIYINSIHNIDFKNKEYTASFWLWLKYKNPAFDFYNNLEIPMAKSVEKSFFTVDTLDDGTIYMLMKLQCVMKDSWKIDNFPFDEQKLRISFENSQFDTKALVFKVDTLGDHFDKRFALRGWNIDSCILESRNKIYETGFGDESLSKPKAEYSAFRVRLSITRSASGLFWKMFLGMYIGFLIAIVCFFIHTDGIDSRFSLAVGAVFAVIGNKYIIDSSLPESTSFTLVDMLHGLTLLFILGTIGANAYSLTLIKKDKLQKANRFDHTVGKFMLALYVLLNIYFIWRANNA